MQFIIFIIKYIAQFQFIPYYNWLNQFDIVVVPDKGVVVVKLNIEDQLGGGNPKDWHYGVILMSQDGYGPNSSRIREINPSPEQYRGGGAPNIVNHPNAFFFDDTSPSSLLLAVFRPKILMIFCVCLNWNSDVRKWRNAEFHRC